MANELTRLGLRGSSVGWVDSSGIVRLDDRRAPIAWWVAADDRWHDPSRSPSMRQRRIDGTPVVETKLAVPGGDVVQTVFAVADQGGCLVACYSNRSPAAVVVAVPAANASTTAATTGTTPQGIDLPHEVRAYPLAHGGALTFAWSLSRRRWGRRSNPDVSALASAEQVVRGWVNAAERASRIPSDAEALTMARSTLLLAEPRDLDELLRREPALGILAIGERVRMGDPAHPWVEQSGDAIRRVAMQPAASVWSSRAFPLAAYVLTQAGEHEAARDVTDLWRRTAIVEPPVAIAPQPGTEASSTDDVIAALVDATIAAARIEDRLVRAVDPDVVHLLPDGVTPWLGNNIEAHGVQAGAQHRLSFAIRWHGKNAAALWELEGPPGMQLQAPRVDARFSTSDAQGEALLEVRQ